MKHVQLKLPSDVTCPKCSHFFKLKKSTVTQYQAAYRRELDRQFLKKEAALTKREAGLLKSQQALTDARSLIDSQVGKKLRQERRTIAATARKKAQLALAQEILSRDRALIKLKAHLRINNLKLVKSQKLQENLIRKQRTLDDAKQKMNLTIEKKVQFSLQAARNEAKTQAEERLSLRLAEREALIAGMQRKIDDLLRSSARSSEQLQGETLELTLKAVLAKTFPSDSIHAVLKGENGGDIIHRINDTAGRLCGTILWEAKQTKKWSTAWLKKARDDQRRAKADTAIIVSSALPKELETFGLVENVWVTQLRFAIPLAMVLRRSLNDLTNSRLSLLGQRTKMERVYYYLTGPGFRDRFNAIVERFLDMQTDLDLERMNIMRIWAKREQQIKGVLESSTGMYGDIEGIVGNVVPAIDKINRLMIDGDVASSKKE